MVLISVACRCGSFAMHAMVVGSMRVQQHEAVVSNECMTVVSHWARLTSLVI